MGDIVWFKVMAVLFALGGLVLILLGLKIWKKQKMELMISYHCDKFSEENKRAYCTLAGIGVCLIGAGLAVSGICTAFIQSLLTLIPLAVGLVLGIALVVTAIVRYNH